MNEHVPTGPERFAENLLGPEGAELGCEECFDALDAYVDLELAVVAVGTEMPRMRAHLAGCPACRDDHDSLALLSSQPGERGGLA